MTNFTCTVGETPLHRYIVDLRLGDKMLLITPKINGSGKERAQEIADFVNEHVAAIAWAPLLLEDEASCALKESE